MQAKRSDSAREQLLKCDEDLRGWEWRLLRLRTHPPLWTLQGHTKGVADVAFSPDGQRLASASADHTVKLWQLGNSNDPRTLRGHTEAVNQVVFSPDGHRLASASDDGTVKIWQAETGKALDNLRHGKKVSHVVFSPDGQRLASVGRDSTGEDTTVKVWQLDSGKEPFTFSADSYDAVFSPDGQRVAVASGGGAIKIYQADTGKELVPPLNNGSTVSQLIFSPDSQRLAVASGDGYVKVWQVESRKEFFAFRGLSLILRRLPARTDSAWPRSAVRP